MSEYLILSNNATSVSTRSLFSDYINREEIKEVDNYFYKFI